MSDKIILPKSLPESFDVSARKLPGLDAFDTLMKDVELMPAISDEGKSTIVKSTQNSISDIHKSTVENTADMTAKSIEAISNIGIKHESKASESIQAIERMTIAGQKSLLKESKSSKKGVFGAALVALGAIGGALSTYHRLKK